MQTSKRPDLEARHDQRVLGSTGTNIMSALCNSPVPVRYTLFNLIPNRLPQEQQWYLLRVNMSLAFEVTQVTDSDNGSIKLSASERRQEVHRPHFNLTSSIIWLAPPPLLRPTVRCPRGNHTCLSLCCSS